MGQNILLLILLALGILGRNNTVALAACLLLALRLLKLDRLFPLIERHGLELGVIVLTIGVLAPLASGSISLDAIWQTVRSSSGLLGIAVGVLVAYLGGRGVHLLTDLPQAATGIIIGTVIGVALLRGVPVGPLIGAGILALLLQYK
ncbi:MAG: DUF441 domain-containing protein [Bacillota bacterium]